ncbi:MAG: hypothetical protein EOP45_13170 [Sphingobacteriaceae bacterium]|nr:MAG: hypothetical protein EOP45_13170 [Sphingobacteriaceae bacterium]
MNPQVQGKINDIKKLVARPKTGYVITNDVDKKRVDGLSMAIRIKEDADTFLTELKAIRKKK